MTDNKTGEQTDPGIAKKVEVVDNRVANVELANVMEQEQGVKIETLAQALESGRPYMEDMVTKRNEFKRPYRESLQERAEKLGEVETLRELQKQVEDLRALLLARTGPNPTPEQIMWAQNEAREGLLKLAHVARAFTRHHRVPPFRVGGAMLALRKVSEEDGNPWAVAFAANTKVDDNHDATPKGEKWCAEQYLMDLVAEPTSPSETGIYKILSFGVVAEPRSDDKSGKLHETLTPCAICRDRMVYDPKLTGQAGILSLETEIVTQSVEDPAAKRIDPVAHLHGMHGESIEVD